MKKHVFHILISVALFCVLTATVNINRDDGGSAYAVRESPGYSGSSITEGDGFKCIGTPITTSDVPETVHPGDELLLDFKGDAYTLYSIRVYYSSGLSESAVLEPKKSDGKGNFGWEFTIPKTVKEGRMRISVLSDKSQLLADIKIVD